MFRFISYPEEQTIWCCERSQVFSFQERQQCTIITKKWLKFCVLTRIRELWRNFFRYQGFGVWKLEKMYMRLRDIILQIIKMDCMLSEVVYYLLKKSLKILTLQRMMLSYMKCSTVIHSSKRMEAMLSSLGNRSKNKDKRRLKRCLNLLVSNSTRMIQLSLR